ncbi:hypothetical protein KDX20_33495, partial [Burkholderia cenocepacia]|uniref:hypothetical protein n=1 Tax=Burkholderia cenocepacia TaxID=95486 RepID=UPI001B9B4C6B
PFGYLFDCLDLELIRVPLAAHPDLLGCHKLWLEDVYERLAGPVSLASTRIQWLEFHSDM